MFDNEQVLLAARPIGEPKPSDFRIEQCRTRAPRSGEVAVRVGYISLEPAMRGWMDDRPSYVRPVRLGEVMRATAAGEVIASESAAFQPGQYVIGHLGAQQVAVVPAEELRLLDLGLAPLDVQVGLLSTSGLTAYFGLLDVGQPKAGETVLVSGAAGAVGSLAGQIARIKGCRVVGVAGGAQKCSSLVDELGFDAGVDYKAGSSIKDALAAACPNGVDVFFDNVGNPVLDAALRHINLRARIVLCGAISQYNAIGKVDGPQNYIALIVKRASMRGFIVFDYEPRYPEAIEALAGWWRAGQLQYRTDVMLGLESFHEALLRLFRGQNRGKALLALHT